MFLTESCTERREESFSKISGKDFRRCRFRDSSVHRDGMFARGRVCTWNDFRDDFWKCSFRALSVPRGEGFAQGRVCARRVFRQISGMIFGDGVSGYRIITRGGAKTCFYQGV